MTLVLTSMLLSASPALEPPPLVPYDVDEAALEERIRQLDARIKALDVNFPKWAGALLSLGAASAYFGLIFSSSGTRSNRSIGPTLLIGGSVAASLGAISGVALSAHARSERDSLVRERTALEKLRPAPGPGSPPQLLEMPSFEAAFAFAF